MIKYIRRVVADSADTGVRTYSDLYFYNLLNVLGDSRLKKIIAVHLKNVKAQNKTLAVVENLNRGDLKGEFEEKIYRNIKKYQLDIKKAFNHYGDVDCIVSEAFNIDYESMFIGIGKYTEDVKKGEDLCAGLFDRGKEIRVYEIY
ncbi:hypothetical protein BHO_0005400 (plasmid) [Borrelia hermsii YBT]|nr:hypothetical protein [Borrelia hermsii]AHH12906.1 hypothetical protein BHO_0005400 [Borrelia hermsii YBT]